MTSEDVVPLPAQLSECGCPHAKAGMHLTSCRPAREHERIPLHQREGVTVGQRYRAVTWVYPLRFEAEIRVTVDVDPLLYIAEHRDEYDAFEMEAGFQEWEKPVAFLAHLIGDDLDQNGGTLTRFGGRRWVSTETSYVDEVREHPAWTPEQTDSLHAALPARVHPGQGVLLEGSSDER